MWGVTTIIMIRRALPPPLNPAPVNIERTLAIYPKLDHSLEPLPGQSAASKPIVRVLKPKLLVCVGIREAKKVHQRVHLRGTSRA